VNAALQVKDERSNHMDHVGKIELGFATTFAANRCSLASLRENLPEQPFCRDLFAVQVPPEVGMTCIVNVRIEKSGEL